MLDSKPLLLKTDFPPIQRADVSTLQVNLGYLCNLSCVHCHVNAGPNRKELMSLNVIDDILRFIDKRGITTLDLTGGAPEMNPHFRYLVTEARKRDVRVIDRCNLTILLLEGYEDLAQFLADQGVEVVASLPCYLEENVSKQRGKGVFSESITAIQKLNALGYGKRDDLTLNLVYNPTGPNLPPPQKALELDYKRILGDEYGVVFNELLTITNMPISRFGSVLMSNGQFDDYLDLLKSNYSSDNLKTVMCRSLLSIDWQGYVYDCDFNQMLEMPLALTANGDILATDHGKTHIADLLEQELSGEAIVIGEHCWGCTAGQGSSCGGALSD